MSNFPNLLTLNFRSEQHIKSLCIFNINFLIDMVQGTFVLSVFERKGVEEHRKIDYRQTKMRYLVVVIAILVVFGCEYCFDNASALQLPIEENQQAKGNKLSEFQFNLLYALYAFPNIIIPLLGGMMIDRIGARWVLIITASFCVVGHLIFGFGGYQNSFGVMLAGRVVFGIGGEVLHASQNTLISNWFKASELSMVLGICLSFPKMGSSLNSYISPKLATQFGTENNWNVAGPIFVGAAFMVISLILAVVLALIDRKSDVQEKLHHQTNILAQEKSSSVSRNILNKKKSSVQGSVRVIETSVLQSGDNEGVQGGQHLNFKEIGKLPLTFWLIILISMLSQALFIPFLDNGNAYYVQVFGVDSEQAGIYLILPYCVSSLFVVILGYAVDKVPKRSILLIASCVFYTITYLFMMYTESTKSMRETKFVAWMPSFLLGICIAIFCTIIVPTIPMLVPPKLLGTGFGIMEMLQNLALGVFPLLGGFLRSTEQSGAKGFHLQTLFFFLISCICTAISIILKGIDLTTGNKLDIKDFRKQYLKKVLGEPDLI